MEEVISYDAVKCVICQTEMLVPHNTDKCPCCGAIKQFKWLTDYDSGKYPNIKVFDNK